MDNSTFLTKQAKVDINGVAFKKKNQPKFFYINSYNNFFNKVPNPDNSSYTSNCAWGYADLLNFKKYGSSAANHNGSELSKNEIDFDAIKSEEDKPLMMSFTSFLDSMGWQHLLFTAGYSNNYGQNSYAFPLTFDVKGLPELIVPGGPELDSKCGIITIAINQPSTSLDYMTLKLASSGGRAQNWMLIQDRSSNIKDLYNNWKQTLIPKTNFSKDRLITSGSNFIDFYSETDNNGVSFI